MKAQPLSTKGFSGKIKGSCITDKLNRWKERGQNQKQWKTGSPERPFFIIVLWLSVVCWHMPVPEKRTGCWLIWLTSDGCRGMASESREIHRHKRQALGYPKTAAASHFLPLWYCRHNTVKYYKAQQLGTFLRFNCKRFLRKGLKMRDLRAVQTRAAMTGERKRCSDGNKCR